MDHRGAYETMTNPQTIDLSVNRHVHNWLRKTTIAFHPGPSTPLLENVASGLLEEFRLMGHTVQDAPSGKVDVILTTASLNRPVPWREALMFRSRRLFCLDTNPTVFTLIHARREELEQLLYHLGKAAAKPQADPAVTTSRGWRRGPMRPYTNRGGEKGHSSPGPLAAGAIDEHPYHPAGWGKMSPTRLTPSIWWGHPQTICTNLKAFYSELVLRILTAVSTHEITEHRLVDDPIDITWKSLTTPEAQGRR
jgi:hypothetical protein